MLQATNLNSLSHCGISGWDFALSCLLWTAISIEFATASYSQLFNSVCLSHYRVAFFARVDLPPSCAVLILGCWVDTTGWSSLALVIDEAGIIFRDFANDARSIFNGRSLAGRDGF